MPQQFCVAVETNVSVHACLSALSSGKVGADADAAKTCQGGV